MNWYDALPVFMKVLMYIAGTFVALIAFARAIREVKGWIKKPREEQESTMNIRMKTFEAEMTEQKTEIKRIYELLKKDKDKLDRFEDNLQVINRSLIALLEQGINGNNEAGMKIAQSELMTHLTNK